MDNSPTVPLAASGATTVALGPSAPSRRRGGFGRELAGALTVGLCVLAVVVLVFQVLAWVRGVPGPGPAMVFGHLGAAVLAVLVQRVADRATGAAATVAALGVVAVTGATMWFLWWA
ncbi:hypothetical protein [Actinophytocola gossypii]|uniref:Uncharacterized protein n=1 Tax=Actinophytocola gossypii TaxID=2812003 RepID=A0ABT2JHF9_9PSEU|nr:hypothetical protein [Actinophytocola gossypii]MCT2587317.1 hypothetical protein [Actinophytocola gossypii]